MWHKSTQDDLDLVFIYDDLLRDDLQHRLKIPMEFVALGYIENYKLFHYRKAYVMLKNEDATRVWGNDRVYGAVYRIKHPKAYLTLLDAYYYYLPSQVENNLRLRGEGVIHLFNIQSLDDLLTYRFKAHKVVRCVVYEGNKNDKRLLRHIKQKIYRETDGIDKVNYNYLLKQLNIIKEATNG